MAGLVKTWLAGESQLLRWLAFEDYAREVFANNHPAWHSEPMRYAAGLADANKVLGSQVVAFDFGAVFATHSGLAADSEGVDRITALLNDTTLNAFCGDAIAAMAHQLSDKVDVVLQLPSPSALLVMLGEDVDNIDFDLLDDAVTVLADLLRDFAQLPVAGLVLAFSDNGVDAGDESEACEVLQGLAAHYDWVFALRLESDDLTEVLCELAADIRLIPTLEIAQLSARENLTGGGLNTAFWSGDALSSISRACLYGDVPANLDPRLIIERVASLA
ncbi:MAG: hypothetical protein DRR04_07795 [Gammaproteobacteria bacterium]|nr:MAG: hypothetical protein DRQ97_09220 [Gammaproteobacteria bacterium]RLA59683.1 MAG: hypothetical protein DRR04_07795 [Gammaproteobacteria bacterium]